MKNDTPFSNKQIKSIRRYFKDKRVSRKDKARRLIILKARLKEHYGE